MATLSTAGAGAAAAAAAAAARREEEEVMTPYIPQDLAEGWEFKILRSSTGAFRNPERLRALLAEEERAGWVLVEKFDDSRVRLKRPAGARERDASLGFDPYRTRVGISEGALAFVIVAAILGVLGLVGLIAVIAARR